MIFDLLNLLYLCIFFLKYVWVNYKVLYKLNNLVWLEVLNIIYYIKILVCDVFLLSLLMLKFLK